MTTAGEWGGAWLPQSARDEFAHTDKLCQACQKLGRALSLQLQMVLSTRIAAGRVGAGFLNITTFQRLDSNPFRDHINLNRLVESLRDGCHLCTLLWASLGDDTSRQPEHSTIGEQPIAIEAGIASVTLSSSIPVAMDAVVVLSVSDFPAATRVAVSIQVEEDINTSEETFKPTATAQAYHKASSTGSSATLSHVKHWIEDCLNNHEACRPEKRTTLDSRALPTRLIDVSSGNSFLRIHQTGEMRSTALNQTSGEYQKAESIAQYDTEYVALSHSWGGANFLKLTTQTYVDFREEFLLDDLPKTWRDAIRITRLLGYRYIWIDALCIIQDSDYDWETEANMMATVYGNCHLNIAALGGANSENGLFQHRNPLLFIPCDVTQLFSEDGWMLGWRVSRATASMSKSLPHRENTPAGHSCAGLCGDYKTAMMNEPLNKRGWVFQERALSPRTIYYGSSGIFWECLTLEADEFSILNSRRVSPTSFQGVLNLEKAISVPKRTNTLVDWQNISTSWHSAIAQYSQTNFTFEKDRLIAISGVARRMQQLTGDKYVAGLWTSTMTVDLLWCVPKLVLGNPSAATGIPTFSWASLGCPSRIHWPHVEHVGDNTTILYHARLMSATSTAPLRLPYNPADRQNPTLGLVQTANIGLDSLVREVTKYPKSATNFASNIVAGEGKNIHFFPDRLGSLLTPYHREWSIVMIHNTKSCQAIITTEGSPLPDPMSCQDARLEQHKQGCLITDHRLGPPLKRSTADHAPRNPLVSHLSLTKATRSSDGKVHDCFGVAAGLATRQQWASTFPAILVEKNTAPCRFYLPWQLPVDRQLMGLHIV